MKLRHPFWISLAAFLAAVLLRVWTRTLRFVVHGNQGHPVDPRTQRCIYVFWHESLLAPATFARHKVHVLISHHADGELIARVCRYLGHGVIRGSTNRGGTEALLSLIRCEQSAHLAITPDGPRGPRRQVQLGVVLLASCTGLPIVPVGVGYSRAWRARSWDRFAVPKPFSTVTGVVQPPIVVPPNLDKEGLEAHRQLVEARLLEATHSAEHSRGGRDAPSASPDPTKSAAAADSLLNAKRVPSMVSHLKKPTSCLVTTWF